MLNPVFTKQFEKDVKKFKKAGNYDLNLLKGVMEKLINKEPLDRKYKDHKLIGNWIPKRECHIKPNWLLIYEIIKKESVIKFIRLGSHSELFR